eukprot:scaffold5143_cov139-Skeletonema_marinoi.AAC.18
MLLLGNLSEGLDSITLTLKRQGRHDRLPIIRWLDCKLVAMTNGMNALVDKRQGPTFYRRKYNGDLFAKY